MHGPHDMQLAGWLLIGMATVRGVVSALMFVAGMYFLGVF